MIPSDYDMFLFIIQWDQEKWKFLPGNQLVFINRATGKAIQIKADGTIEATVDPYTNQKTGICNIDCV